MRNNSMSRDFFTRWGLMGIGLAFLFYLLFYSGGLLFNKKIDYNTQVKPILNKYCIHCHGGVKQNGGFSLITRDLALRKNDSGNAAIVPGSPQQSELIRRILSEDIEDRMPQEAPPLPEEAIHILKKWIKEGAEWGIHWAYQPLKEVNVPSNAPKVLGSFGTPNPPEWANNEIDHFILEKMTLQRLVPNEPATKEALLRRVSLDLIGLPPPANLAEQFLATENPISYQQLIDSLLVSPHFGERWASVWLDLARYADSKGFERDVSRSIWEYRDYVIRAFNKDLPYDQFIIEQLAGDLLPNPTEDQYIATGFHRNTTTNDEGGTDNEEYRMAAVIDRNNTTWEAILGTTFSCVQCHGHPYDPIFHEEYYQSLAFFNNTRDFDTYADYPWLRKFSPMEKEKLDSLQQWVAKVESPERAAAIRTFIKTLQPIIYSIETDSFINADLYDTKYLGFRKAGQARMAGVGLTGKNRLLLKAKTTVQGGQFSIHQDHPTGKEIVTIQLPNTNWKNQIFDLPIQLTEGQHDLYLKYANPSLKDPNMMAFQIDWFHFTTGFPGEGTAEYTTKKQDFWNLLEAPAPHTLILMENTADRHRKTHVFDRGNRLILTKEVQPNIPVIFGSLPEDAPKNRLGFAQWVVHKNNPLTARTIVNRLWEQVFGMGLSETLEDLGTQGVPPTHPELLDWLSLTFMEEYQWSIKKILRLMVSSTTYQQSAKATTETLEKDPYNRFHTRGPRIRLTAEQIRDQALAVSGLFNAKMYGPPVMPYQPEGLWQIPYNAEAWKVNQGDSTYRRAIYTFIKRSAPYPSFETFDVAPRQVCVSRRIRTNTPLQALVTLNDPVYVEAAQHLALRMQQEKETNISQRIQKGYQLATGQVITPAKQRIFEALYHQAYTDFEHKETQAAQLLGNLKEVQDSTATAALVVVANSMMNLDEFLTK